MIGVKKGSTNVAVYLNLKDATTGNAATGLTITDLDLQYTRELTAAAAKVDAVVGDGSETTHEDGKVKQLDATSSPGLHLVCFPDAAFATGVDSVILCVSGSAIEPAFLEIPLTFFDPHLGTLGTVLAVVSAEPSDTPTVEAAMAWWQHLSKAEYVADISSNPNKFQIKALGGANMLKRAVTIDPEASTTIGEVEADS